MQSMRYAELMGANRRALLVCNEGNRNVSWTSRMSTISVASSTVSDFLADKVEQMMSDRDVLIAYRDGLIEIKKEKIINESEFQKELDDIVGAINPLSQSLHVLESQKRALEQDMEDQLAIKRRREHEPEIDFYERAYTSSLVPRVMGSSGNQTKNDFSKHDQADFRRAVLDRYGAGRINEYGKEAYCHLSGWWPSGDVKAAHLVPKSLTGSEISFLFGVGEMPLKDARNGISLHKNIELALDTGNIAIIPSITSHATVEWKCVVVNEQTLGNVAISWLVDPVKSLRRTVTWKDLDGKLLLFNTDNRPARRFLYFRFLITYIHAKMAGNTSFTSTVEHRQGFWASPGPYLERSTLTSLARNISGLELPPSIYTETFDNEGSAHQESDYIGTILAAKVREATIESAKRLEYRSPPKSETEEDETEEDETEEDETEEDETEEDETDYY